MFFGAGVLASIFSVSPESMFLNVQCSGVPATVSLDQVILDVLQGVQVVGNVQSTEDDAVDSVTIECVGCDDLTYHQVLSWQGMVAFDVFQRTGILPHCNINLFDGEDEPSAARLGAPAPVVDMLVEIDVDCKGLKESELSMKALGYSTHALKEAYNQVHLKTDGGDAVLSGLHFDHVVRHKAETLGLELAEDMLTSSRAQKNAEKNKNRYKTPPPSSYIYMGGWGCRLCPADDDVMLGLGDSGVALIAWENAYAKALRESAFPEFSEVQKCDIKMHAVNTPSVMVPDASVAHLATNAHLALLTSVANDTDEVDGMPVEVAFDCKAVDEANLSLKAIAYAGHALEEAYNQVHLKTDGGDAVLSGLHFDHVVRHKAETLGLELADDMLTSSRAQKNAEKNKNRYKTPPPSSYIYMGGWGCRLCPPDDDVMLGLGDSGAALSAWANAFTAALQEGPFPEFKKANSCEITMKASHSSASIAATA